MKLPGSDYVPLGSRSTFPMKTWPERRGAVRGRSSGSRSLNACQRSPLRGFKPRSKLGV